LMKPRYWFAFFSPIGLSSGVYRPALVKQSPVRAGNDGPDGGVIVQRLRLAVTEDHGRHAVRPPRVHTAVGRDADLRGGTGGARPSPPPRGCSRRPSASRGASWSRLSRNWFGPTTSIGPSVWWPIRTPRGDPTIGLLTVNSFSKVVRFHRWMTFACGRTTNSRVMPAAISPPASGSGRYFAILSRGHVEHGDLIFLRQPEDDEPSAAADAHRIGDRRQRHDPAVGRAGRADIDDLGRGDDDDRLRWLNRGLGTTAFGGLNPGCGPANGGGAKPWGLSPGRGAYDRRFAGRADRRREPRHAVVLLRLQFDGRSG